MKTLKTSEFWLASCTWGIIMTLAGAIVALALLIAGRKPKILFGRYVCFEVGSGWGGVNFGPFIVVSKSASSMTKLHEAGHGLQNIMLGVFMPFVICIPSVIRYWYRKYKTSKGEDSSLPSYDSIWFEGWATSLGTECYS